MELMLIPKGNKFIVEDKKSRLLYTIKKKAFGGKFILLDASGYELYSFVQTVEGKKPEFEIILNDALFMRVRCLSVFLEPSIEFDHANMHFVMKSMDRRKFDLFKDNSQIGCINTVLTPAGDLKYEIEIENSCFDDYIPFFALAVERAFGDMNKSK